MFNALTDDSAHVADIHAEILDVERSISSLRLEKELVLERLRLHKYLASKRLTRLKYWLKIPVLTAFAAERSRDAEIDAKTLELRGSLSALRERRNSYSRVWSLPNEIITEIFIHSLPNYPLCPPLSGSYSPTRLTQICREWRKIAVGTPALWRAVSFTYSIPFAYQLCLCRIWLARSCSVPLSLACGIGVDIRQVLEVFTPHRERWEYLSLHLSLSHLPAIQGPTPLLRQFNLMLQDRHLTRTKVALTEAPLLRTVLLDSTAAEHILLPWAQLTSLTLYTVNRAEYVAILQKASRLVHCELGLVKGLQHNLQPLPVITLRFLESLVLGNPDGKPVTGFLETLIVPALRRLRISESFLAPNPIILFAAFIVKSNCKLQEVCVRGERLVSQASYRKAYPSIKFSFTDRYRTDEEDTNLDTDEESIVSDETWATAV
ncbi:F-box domain-containing protein [Mycena venus]|uniref:F-box domain-containing protein n=1 Tax=Mycena venus TaxID=2733690 RepID=A0A8H6XGW2_9AGAR|nr:F-box domain-containing protein [Mycena venus]